MGVGPYFQWRRCVTYNTERTDGGRPSSSSSPSAGPRLPMKDTIISTITMTRLTGPWTFSFSSTPPRGAQPGWCRRGNVSSCPLKPLLSTLRRFRRGSGEDYASSGYATCWTSVQGDGGDGTNELSEWYQNAFFYISHQDGRRDFKCIRTTSYDHFACLCMWGVLELHTL